MEGGGGRAGNWMWRRLSDDREGATTSSHWFNGGWEWSDSKSYSTPPLGGCLDGVGVEWGGGGAQQGRNSWPQVPNRGLLPPSPATKHIFCLFLESPDVTLGQKTTRPQEMSSLSLALMPQSNQLMRELLATRGGITLIDLLSSKYFDLPPILSQFHNSLQAWSSKIMIMWANENISLDKWEILVWTKVLNVTEWPLLPIRCN